MHPLRGILAILYMALNTVFWALLCCVMTLVRILLPRTAWRVQWAARMNAIVDGWVTCNRAMFRALLPTEIETRGVEGLARDEWYLLLSNHRSWTDILVLQTVFRDLVPPLKFFTKMQLLWVPFLGQALWALDFPFMRRYSREFLKQHPHLRGKDLETTRQLCERFRLTPTAVIIFVEGTRLTDTRHAAQGSTYRHLLMPRAGGIGFVLSAMGDQLNRLVDITIVYPEGTPNFWGFLCGRVPKVIVDATVEPLSTELARGNYERNDAYRLLIQQWITERWEVKDARIEMLLHPEASAEFATDRSRRSA